MPEKHIGSKSKHHKKHKSSHKKHKHHVRDSDEPIEKNIDVDDIDNTDQGGYDQSDDNRNNEEPAEDIQLGAKTRERLKKKIISWMDFDDKIKDLNAGIKKYKDAKKQQEELIITMITKLGMDEKKIDVHDDSNNLRGRVYRHKSVTKGALKEDIIKDALMEAIRDEKKVDQLVKKIESRRPINERYYLKRTKGSQD
jgi:hypothetical protein